MGKAGPIADKIFLNLFYAAFIICCMSLVSCENDMKTIRAIGLRDTGPTEILTAGELIYSDSGKVQILVKTPLIHRYDKEKVFMEMPKGIKVLFFDSTLTANSWLTANYAKSYDNDNKFEAKYDVVVVNVKGERLNTERLVWDTQKKIIYSDQFVRITTKDRVLLGEGMEADERFDKWKIIYPTGSIDIEEPEDE